jgi:uncharacterized protein with HEPN domain
MSRHDPLVRLRHMLDYACEAVATAHNRTVADLSENRQLSLALTHLVELIGEAASQVPGEFQAQHPEIPWPKIISTRNRLIHGYDFVDYDILWDTITNDLPPLIKVLERILAKAERKD